MKRKTLTSAVLAGMAGVAGIASISNAVNLNPDGLGEVLIYPFYTVNGGNDTLISVVNTTDDVKAVKVRFLESLNSQEVLDFNLYLSPFDVWVAAITREPGNEAGPAVVAVPDLSCTVPSFFLGGAEGTINGIPFVRFRTFQMGDDIGPSAARTREGYIEMIEMGTLDAGSQAAADATHTAAGVPANCGRLNNRWAQGGSFAINPRIGVGEPTGGLFGGGSIINVLQGFQASYNADAIAGFFDPGTTEDLLDDLHSAPDSLIPSLNEADTGGARVVSNVFDNARVVTSEWIEPVDAVSAVFMRDSVFNEYAIDSALNAATEWVLTFPTKRFYVNGTVPRAPFTSTFDEDGACEEVGIQFYDREEQAPIGRVNFSPSPRAVNELCFEAQVVSFGEGAPPSAILGSPTAENIPVDSAMFENGWAEIRLDEDNQEYTSDEPIGADTYRGLPVTGFAMQVVQNGFLFADDGSRVLSNYAGMFDHRYSREIVGS